MDLILRVLAVCHDGLVSLTAQPAGLSISLFLAGLAGSALHCVGMCGPFVLGQVAADVERIGTGYGEWRRLAGAALLPYHLGRVTTYTGLGALAGGVTALFASTAAFGLLSGLLLVGGAALMLAQAVGLATTVATPATGLLTRLASGLSTSANPISRYALGVVLGFLPCGMIYGALGAAAGTGSAWLGAAAMAGFALGTIPALVMVGWGGLFVRRRLREVGRWVFAPLLLLNAVFMLALAGERFGLVVNP
ncbi:hypothetical protein SAMN02745126_03474 [Enhydrobacter aerosaccus]|uniref:Urease accessory protein UreH-like transmembrane domain-containing protein n=1 Tax=Enhydrobacter aerosaccus TaxID=225324 RepID=A0A1T4R0T3_9HYPH|nr:sulfite exporter TauE/SafE family protein [Enhydrobacter aerosaccus]SKA09604.1 hypothetical protein SAMN02745126_03474 [Enhydrobacter aerosaccus]